MVSRVYSIACVFVIGIALTFLITKMWMPRILCVPCEKLVVGYQPEPENNVKTARVYRFNGQKFSRLNEFCTWTLKMDCVTLRTDSGPTPIHIHNVIDDRWVSGSIKAQGAWEPSNIRVVISQLKRDADSGFMDLGSHVGAFSISVAKFGRKVVSVDPLIENVKRLCKSIEKGQFTDNMTIIFNPLSDKHNQVNFKLDPGNVGGTRVIKTDTPHQPDSPCGNDVDSFTVTLDDILPYIPFRKVVIKMDVQEHEFHVLKGATRFFKEMRVYSILMEWDLMKLSADAPKLIAMLTELGFKPHEPREHGNELQISQFNRWPYDIIWIMA